MKCMEIRLEFVICETIGVMESDPQLVLLRRRRGRQRFIKKRQRVHRRRGERGAVIQRKSEVSRQGWDCGRWGGEWGRRKMLAERIFHGQCERIRLFVPTREIFMCQ